MKTRTNSTNRLFFLDNARTLIIFLVIMLHAAAPYLVNDMLGWFWIVEDPANNNASSIIFLFLDIFLMATLFFISGYLAPLSLEDKSGWDFVKSKFKRLMLPWAAAVITLIPLYKVIFLYSRELPQEHWSTYFHFINPNSQKWLWFLPVLFSFNLLYLLIRKIDLRVAKLPTYMVVGISFMICVEYSFAMEMLGLDGWTSTPLLDFQNERLLIYFVFFLLGVMFNNRGALKNKNGGKSFYILINSVLMFPLGAFAVVTLWPLMIRPGSYMISHSLDIAIKALTYNLCLFFLVYIVITSFMFFGNKAGKCMRVLHRNTYGVYIVHVIITGLFTLLLRETGIPAFVKFLILTMTTFVVSNLIVSGARIVFGALKLHRKEKGFQIANQYE